MPQPPIQRSFARSALALALALLAASSCALLPRRQAAFTDGPLAPPRRNALVESARGLVGQSGKLTVRGRTFNGDCTGTVLAACWGAGLDLLPALSRAPGSNGVRKLYHAFEATGLLLDRKDPEPGDLVFWDDTYDENGNGKADDPLTHVGIVVSADGWGGFGYVHYRYDRGVVEERMDLRHPSERSGPFGDTRNSSMRMKSWKPSGDLRGLSGELYDDGGSTANFPSGWEGR